MNQQFSVSTLRDYWEAKIRRDLTPFSDPGTEVGIVRQGQSMAVRWSQRAVPKEATFHISQDKVTVHCGSQSYLYRDFFASAEMADLRSLAKMILQARKPRTYVNTKATLDDSGDRNGALETIQEASREPAESDATVVVMITGDAGAGKSSVLEELVRVEAERFALGQAKCLYLYVNAQGRALAKFTEALAAELDELRSILTYHEVTPLVRLGLLVPVIDGFDELLGVGGYGEAFSSLSAFIEELDGSGRLIASARSTYYEQEFVARAGASSALGSPSWIQRSVRIEAWDDQDFESYVQKICDSRRKSEVEKAEALAAVRAAFQGDNAQLVNKPLFVARTLELVLDGRRFEGDGNLLDSLVSTYIERERVEKLLDRNQRPLLSAPEIRALLVELAEEMWNQETRQLDIQSVRSIAEYVLGNFGIAPASQRVVIERMPTMAFLSKGDRAQNVAFEHETFFGFFLSQGMVRRIVAADTPIDVLLGRSSLSLDMAGLVARQLARRDNPTYESFREIIGRVCAAAGSYSPRQVQVQENGGRIIQGLLKVGCGDSAELRDLEFSGLIFAGGDFTDVRLKNSKFSSIEFRRVDFRGCDIRECSADNVMLVEAFLDLKSTRLELHGLDPATGVLGLRVAAGAEVSTVFLPDRIREALHAVGAISKPETISRSRSISPNVVEVVERFVKGYSRSNLICLDDRHLRAAFEARDWPIVYDALLRSGVVTEEVRVTSGSTKSFLRRQVLPAEILAGIDESASVPKSVTLFWDQIEENC